MESPLISVVIPCYNRAGLIEQTLSSVVAQTFSRWECLVVDDGSNDDTMLSVNRIAQGEERIKLYKRPESYLPGGNGARNFGLDVCNGQYVIFLDSDDLLIEDCLANRAREISCANIDFVISSTGIFKNEPGDTDLLWNEVRITDDGNQLIGRFLENDMPWHTNGVTWSRDFVRSLGGWKDGLKAWQDWEIHIRALVHSNNFYLSPRCPDNFHRIGGKGQISSRSSHLWYYNAVLTAIRSAEVELRSSERLKGVLLQKMKGIILRWQLRYPWGNGQRKFVVKRITDRKFFRSISRITFSYYLMVELLDRSTNGLRINRFVNQLRGKAMNFNSTHMKCKISEIYPQ